jgi:allantoicase
MSAHPSTTKSTGAPAVAFGGLVDLAASALGARVLATSDEFFAEASNLLKPGRGIFLEGTFTDRGKWMDGWESRRRRTPGHDWCVVELGVSGRLFGFDIDTNHFLGNAPSFASVDGLCAPRGTPPNEFARMAWTPLLRPCALLPGSQNLFAASPAESTEPVSHVRLNIFPDGGVARFRAFGRVEPAWDDVQLDAETLRYVPPGAVDLAALTHGGLALACSDAFFGPMNNLIAPGRAANMGDGWETRRRRGPGHDWIVVQLGARGIPVCVEVDTNHFLGNCPARCSIEWIAAEGAKVTDLVVSATNGTGGAGAPPINGTGGAGAPPTNGTGWAPLLAETSLKPHTRHFFNEVLARTPAAATHVRLNIFPDGGISRLRVWGRRT